MNTSLTDSTAQRPSRRVMAWRMALIVVPAGLFPIFLTFCMQVTTWGVVWRSDSVHMAVELAGSAVALAVAMLLLIRLRHEPGTEFLFWISLGLIAMGLLDVSHAVAPFGMAWSWLRHVATLIGGLLFALVWIRPPPAIMARRRMLLPIWSILIFFTVLLIWIHPTMLPWPWKESDYTPPVAWANGVGGMGFLIACLYFIRRFVRSGQPDDWVFAAQTMLFGVAGLLFGFAHVWTADWWVWHLSRLAAYGVMLLSAYILVSSLYKKLAENAATLERQVETRTAELARARKEAEAERAQLQAVYHAMTDAVSVYDMEGKVVMMNGAMFQRIPPWLRREPRFDIQKIAQLFEFCDLDGQRIPLDHLPASRVVSGESLANLELRVKSPASGKIEVLSFSGEPVRDANGQQILAVVAARDITEAKQAEEALRESEERLSKAFAATPDGLIISTESEGSIRYANEGFRVLFGLLDEEVTGRKVFELGLYATPEDRSRALQIVREEGQLRDFETQIRCSSGKIKDALLSIEKLSLKGEPLLLTIIRDISQQKRVQRALKEHTLRQALLLEATQEMVSAGYDHESLARVIFENISGPLKADVCFNYLLNEAAQKLELIAAPGLPPHIKEQVRTLRLGESFCGAAAKTGSALVASEDQVLRDPNGAFGRELGLKAYACHPLKARSGKLLGTFAVASTRRGKFTPEDVEFLQTLCHFISLAWERLAAEGALREAREQLQQHAELLEKTVQQRTAKLQELLAELEHFSYTITHDMRAPLRAINGFAELAKESCTPGSLEDAKAFLRKIASSAQRMDLLITDALNYSKTVRQELTLVPVDLSRLLQSMLDSYPEFQASKAAIVIAGELPVVMGNEAALTQCFSNLLGNAVKFVEKGQLPQVRLWAETLEGDKARINVEDKGIGVPTAMQPRIFDMFSRGHNSQEYEGTGIGLALVRKVVMRMGGKVGVESQVGHGSRFWVELPLATQRARVP